METITYTNTQGQSMSFTYGGNYLIESYDGFGSASIEANDVKGYGQHGYTHAGLLYGTRVMNLKVWIVTNTSYAAYEQRSLLHQVFNPLLGGTLTYTNDYCTRCIDCYVSFPPEPATDKKYGNLNMYDITLTATNPFWYDPEEQGIRLIGAQGGCRFALKFDSTIKFGLIGNNGDVVNAGNVPSPLRITLKNALQINPKIQLVGTDYFIKINKTISSAEEVVVVNTAYGNKTIKINGQSAMRYLDEDSTFFDLPIGTNKIVVSTTSGEPEVYLNWFNYYTGV